MSEPFEDLAAFATEDRIIRLIAKERGKFAAKNGGSSNPFKSDLLFSQLREMTPPHKLWTNPGRGKLPKKASHGLARWTGRKKRASIRVYQAIRKNIDTMPDALWVKNLNAFILSIQKSLFGDDTPVLETLPIGLLSLAMRCGVPERSESARIR